MSEKLHGPVLVLTDHTGDDQHGYALTEQSKRLLSTIRHLCEGEVWAAAFNPDPDREALAAYGTDHVCIPELGEESPRIPGVLADAAAACVKAMDPSPTAIFLVSNARGKDVAAQLSVLLGSGASVDVSSVDVRDGEIVSGKAVLGGTWKTQFHITRGTPVIALRTTTLTAQHSDNRADVHSHNVPVEFRHSSQAVRVVSSSDSSVNGPSLTDAPVVVCGGRGTNGDFTLVNQLAGRLGGAVGATRVATDQGWIDRSAQVGQSGESIAPALYIGLGLSGDIHHVSGIRGAQTIVAVCDDPEAPIFDLVDFGVVGDMNTVVAKALKELE